MRCADGSAHRAQFVDDICAQLIASNSESSGSNKQAGGGGQHRQEDEEDEVSSTSAPPPSSRTTFNEDEYTKITTPRQDMLFKKGYLGRKKTTPTPSQDTTDAQSADSIESEQYCCDEPMPPYMYPAPTGYIDHTGMFYVPNYEVYDPYTGGVTVVVGPAPGFPGPHSVLTALPCAPVPLQPVEWFTPLPPQPPLHLQQPPFHAPHKKSSNSIDSQNWSCQSSESTCPPGSPQDSTEQSEVPPYIYPGYMFGPPVCNMNGMNVQGVLPTASQQPPTDPSKRRKKRRRRRRGGVTDEGSESSCEEVCSIEAPGSSASSSKTNSDSGIATDPCRASAGQGSLSSLSNDEAEKDNKSIPSEGDIPSSDVKEEVKTGEPSCEDSMSITEKPTSSVDENKVLADSEHACTTPEIPDSTNKSSNDNDSPAVVDSSSGIESSTEVEEAKEPEVEQAEEIPEVSAKPAEPIEDSEETQDTSEQVSENQDDDDDEDEEVLVETTEAFSEDESEDKEHTCSSDGSTLPCTAEDHSIEESPIEIGRVEQLESDIAEWRLQEKDDLISTTEEDRIITGFNDVSMYDLDHLELEPDPPPVAPPRKKKCAKVAEKLASRLSEEIVLEAVTCAADTERWPITSAVTKWLEDSEDEIEEAEEALLTGQKNGEGNPFLAPYHSGSGTRVASNLRYSGRMREMCDPVSSVNKYYRLALPMKTGPFPCGICCIIQ